jgi:3-hydroxyisobutyrate dehydrogenase-like beta-hydroxyacid dehydrogenase
LCLPTDQEAETALFGPNGIVAGQCSNSILIDTTTMDRNATLKLADRASKAGLTYCDCPVSGLPQRAEDGTLTAMFGGAKENFEHLKPLLLTFSKTVLHCGGIGSGQAMKAVNNIIYNINIAALCEVLPLAVAAGLGPQQLAQLVTSGSSSSFASGHGAEQKSAMLKTYEAALNIQFKSTKRDTPLKRRAEKDQQPFRPTKT